MNPKMVEVLGNLALKVIEEGLKQRPPSRQQIPTQIGMGPGRGSFWPPVPPVFPTLDFSSMFDPSGFNSMFDPGFGPAIGWNGNPYFG